MFRRVTYRLSAWWIFAYFGLVAAGGSVLASMADRAALQESSGSTGGNYSMFPDEP